MQNNVFWLTASILLACNCFVSVADVLKNPFSTAIANEPDGRLLLLSTLDGSLVAIEQHTGEFQWKITDKPAVTVPLDTTDAIVPLFLPDPRDGSLYLLGSSREPLKKLPFTIPQLVASSPCRSSDGLLYTGKKKDVWFKLDPKTGQKHQILGWETSSTCPIPNESAIYVGRTQYSIMMVDSRNTQRKWNVTFYDYSANPLSKEMLQNYDWMHFTSTSTGRIVTIDRARGTLLWDKDMGSPIIAAYILDSEGLLSIPFTSMANHTISHLVSQYLNHNQPFQNQPTNMKLYPTLYIGEHMYGLYALPSLVDQNMVTITASETGPLLLEGPDGPKFSKPYSKYPIPGHNYHIPQGSYNSDSLTFQSIIKDNNYIYIGHYNVPDNVVINRISGANIFDMRLLTDESKPLVDFNSEQVVKSPNGDEKVELNKLFENGDTVSVGTETDPIESEFEEMDTNYSYIIGPLVIQQGFKYVKSWLNQQENKGLKLMVIILSGCIVAMFWYFQMQVRGIQQNSHMGSRSNPSSSSWRYDSVTAIPEELPNGVVKVGKIAFQPEEVLGKGCDGTFVYRGEFDKRQVAVKRLLPECFTIADREVTLLRESDAHANVIRYFCMEQDRMFRYIALELCQATLNDYVMGKCDPLLFASLSSLDILKQATAGLAHLHTLDIVHRDIKPQNVLLSMPNSEGKVRAMISDFGLCKKLQLGRVSFSRRSGITGTEGWIAPEMLDGNERITCAVDMFSLGCMFYYVLSEGVHPFGDTLHRQANILSNVFNLEDLKGETWQAAIQKPLLAALLSPRAQERPNCNAVLSHPIFWDSVTILAFFQEVSDRIDKMDPTDDILKTLERGSEYVVRGNWRAHVDEEVHMDLRKYRSYRGESIRDLLRALRNKKHHYRELTPTAQEMLGDTLESFTTYWTSRFPLLLIHTWLSMQIVAQEAPFKTYYHFKYRYSLTNYKNENDILYPIVELYLNDLLLSNIEPQMTITEPGKYNKRYYRFPPPEIQMRNSKPNYTRYLPSQLESDFDEQKVGLYRNANPKVILNKSPKRDKINVDNAQSVNNEVEDFIEFRRYNGSQIIQKSPKREKPNDENDQSVSNEVEDVTEARQYNNPKVLQNKSPKQEKTNVDNTQSVNEVEDVAEVRRYNNPKVQQNKSPKPNKTNVNNAQSINKKFEDFIEVRRHKKKKTKVQEEPLTWVIPDKN